MRLKQKKLLSSFQNWTFAFIWCLLSASRWKSRKAPVPHPLNWWICDWSNEMLIKTLTATMSVHFGAFTLFLIWQLQTCLVIVTVHLIANFTSNSHFSMGFKPRIASFKNELMCNCCISLRLYILQMLMWQAAAQLSEARTIFSICDCRCQPWWTRRNSGFRAN